MEDVGGPRPIEGFPNTQHSGLEEPGQGRVDAYGRPIENRAPEEKAPKKRLSPGAYGQYDKKIDNHDIPDPNKGNQTPIWSFK